MLSPAFTISISSPSPPWAPGEDVSRASDSDELARLVAAMAEGDRGEALEAFYQRFAGSTMGLILKILRSRAEAEELHQEVFVELWRRAPEYDRSRGSVPAWVARVARSRAIDWVRARKRRGAGKHVQQEDVAIADDRPSPELQTAQARRRQLVQSALGDLGAEQREALELSYFRGLSHSEIAAELDLPLGTVKSRILAAMRVLRRVLSEEGSAA